MKNYLFILVLVGCFILYCHANQQSVISASRCDCHSFECNGFGVDDKGRKLAKAVHECKPDAPPSPSPFPFFTLSSYLPVARTWVDCQLNGNKPVSVEEALQNFDMLSRRFVAQPRALDQIRNVITSHLNGRGPTSLHLVGDNGLGKTSMAKLISLALYRKPNQAAFHTAGYGFFHISCLEVKTKPNRAGLVESVLNFVDRNPNAVVLVDDVHYLVDQPQILDSLSVLFSAETFSGRDLRGVLFVLTSNTGLDYSAENISDAELDQKVYYHHLTIFKNHVLTEIPHLIALRPFSFDGFYQVVESLFRTFYCDFSIAKKIGPYTPYLRYQLQVVQHLAELAWFDGRRLRMGRVIQDQFNAHIVDPLLSDRTLTQRYPLQSNQVISISLDNEKNFIYSIDEISIEHP